MFVLPRGADSRKCANNGPFSGEKGSTGRAEVPFRLGEKPSSPLAQDRMGQEWNDDCPGSHPVAELQVADGQVHQGRWPDDIGIEAAGGVVVAGATECQQLLQKVRGGREVSGGKAFACR